MAIIQPPQLATGSYNISGSFSGSFQGSGAGLNSIPSSAVVGLSSSLNIGTTPIASGTVGRVLFEGTGNVLQQSGNLFWDSTNSRLGIGTNSPSAPISIINGNGSPTASGGISFGTPTANFQIGNYFNIGILNVSQGPLLLLTNTQVAIGSNYANANIETNVMFFIRSLNTTSATKAVSIQNSAATSLFNIWNDGNVGVNTATNAGFKLDVNGTARFGSGGTINIADSGQMYGSGVIALQCFQGVPNNRSVLVNINPNETTITNAAILAANSTTKGFLPPRTTLTSNISSSIQGLMTYVNSGSNEGLYYYNSGSAIGWHKVLTNSGSQNISGSLNLSGFATGSVLFTSGSAGAITGSANLFWDNTNGRLGIGTSTPTERLSVNGNISFTGPGYLTSSTNNIMVGQDAGGNYLFAGTNAANTPPRLFIGRMNTSTEFQTNGGFERMRIASGGNILIGTTTDAGFRLDVNGTARVVNNFTVGNVIQNGGNANTFATIINHMGAAQSVSGFNTTRINANTDLGVGFAGAPDASAVVELRGTTKGFLPPRMTGAQAELISSPAEGLMIYATTGTGVTITSKGWWGYDGATWVKFN
jgi:hypothetical protein